MAGRQEVGAEVPRRLEQVGEFHLLVAGDAGDRRLAADIGARERLDHLLAKALLVVEHVMGNAEARRDVAGVVDVLAGAAGALAVRRLAMIVELHRHADDVVALAASIAATTRRIDAARHRHDDARVFGRPCRGRGCWSRGARPARGMRQAFRSRSRRDCRTHAPRSGRSARRWQAHRPNSAVAASFAGRRSTGAPARRVRR